MMDELLSLRVALSPDVMTTVRLATGGVCSLVSLSYDDGEDCKVCVTESLLLLLRRGFSSARVSFAPAEGGMRVCVTGEACEERKPFSDEDEIALALLHALAREVTMDKAEGEVGEIAFLFGQTA